MFLGIGATLCGLPAAALATTLFAILTGTDVHKYLPLGVLMWESRYADAARSKAIAAELLARYSGKKLDEDQGARAVACALDVQGNERIPWAAEWGDLIETARTDGKLAEADEARFRTQAAVLKFVARPRVRAGDPFPVSITLKEARIGSGTALTSRMYLKSATLDGKTLKASQDRRSGLMPTTFVAGPDLGWLQLFGASNRMWGGQAFGQGKLLVDVPKTIEPGAHQAVVKLVVLTKPQNNRMGFSYGGGLPKKDDPDQRAFERTLTVTVEPDAGVELVKPAADAAKKMREILQPSSAMVYVYNGQASASVQFGIEGRPMDGAFDVIWKADGREWSLGHFSTGTSADPWDTNYNYPGAENQRSVSGSIEDFDASTVDVVLRPSQKAALRTTDLFKIYGEELVFKDVPVTIRDQSGNTTSSVTKKPKGPNLWLELQRALGGR